MHNIIRRLSPLDRLLLGVVLLLTVAALTGGSEQHPVDARTHQPVDDLLITTAAAASLLEPLLAPFHIVQFTPDYRSGAISMIVWSLLLICVTSIVSGRKQGDALPRTVRNLLLLLCVIAGYALFAFSNMLPNPAFQKQSDGAIVADLHSHSLLSHDGLIDAADNLKLHRQRGFDLVALTDHVDPGKSTEIRVTSGGGAPDQGIIPGIEIPAYFGSHCYFLVIGTDRTMPLPAGVALYHGRQLPLTPPGVYEWRTTMWSLERFVRTVHAHHGVIIAIAYQIVPEDVRLLAQSGVDAFELVNYGHKPLAADVRRALLDAQRTENVALLASNDWHGWTGALNAATLITGKAERRGQPARDRLLAALRDREVDHIVPITMRPVHTMSWPEIILAPFTASWHYACTLGGWQLLSWWGWILMLLLVNRQSGQRRLPLSMLWPFALLIAGGIELYDGVAMLFFSHRTYSEHPGLYTGAGYLLITAGAVALLFAAWHLRRRLAAVPDRVTL